MTHSRNLTRRRDFLKMLGLGGLAAAPAVGVGAKLLGGTIKEAGKPSVSDVDVKISSPDFDPARWRDLISQHLEQSAQELARSVDRSIMERLPACSPELWSQEALKRLEEAAPCPIGQRPRLIKVSTDTLHSTIKMQGTFTETREYAPICITGRGQLDTFIPGEEKVNCNLEGQLDWVQGYFVEAIKSGVFRLEIEGDVPGEWVVYPECRAHSVAYDMASGYFSVDFTCKG